MPSTPLRALPYPDSTGHTRLWEWFQQLAEAIEAKLVGSSTAKTGKRIHWNAVSLGAADSSGFVTVTHGAGFTPTVVICQLARATGSLYTDLPVDSITSTTFRVRLLGADGAIGASVGAGVPITYFCGE